MAINKQKKHELRELVEAQLKGAEATVIAEYRGMTMAALTELRTELRKTDSQFQVMKNRVVIKAIERAVPEADALKEKLTGPVGMVHVRGDIAAGAKTILAFAKGNESFKVTGGVMEGKELSVDDLKALSELPSRDVLLAKIAGSLVAPHRGLLGVLSGVQRNLVQVINAIKDQKSA